MLRLTSLGSGISQTGVAVILLAHQPPVLLLPLAAVNGIFQALTIPTMRGIVPQPASGGGIQQANSLLASARNITRLLGPSAAGRLTVSVGGGWAIAADAASFLVAAVCFAKMSLPDLPPRAKGDPTMLNELRQGWRYFSSRPWIWSVALAFAVFNAAHMGIWNILGPVIAVDTIGADGWGLVLSARGAGALLATVVMVKLTVRRPMAPAMCLMALAGVPLILLGTGANVLWLAASAFAAGVAAEFFTVAWSTVWHTHIPERLSSRVGAYDEFGSSVSIPIGQLSAPPPRRSVRHRSGGHNRWRPDGGSHAATPAHASPAANRTQHVENRLSPGPATRPPPHLLLPQDPQLLLEPADKRCCRQ